MDQLRRGSEICLTNEACMLASGVNRPVNSGGGCCMFLEQRRGSFFQSL